MGFPLVYLMDEAACYARLVAVLHLNRLAFPCCGGADRIGVHRRHCDPVVDY